MRGNWRILNKLPGKDDKLKYLIRRDYSGGMNNRVHVSQLAEKYASVVYNIDLSVPGKMQKRPGYSLIANDVGNESPYMLFNYDIQGATSQLLMYEGTTLYKWEGSGNWTSLKTDFNVNITGVGIVQCKESGLAPDDVVLISNGVDNVFRMDSSGNFQDLGDTNDSPPKSKVMCWYGNRVWILKDDLLYFSDAYTDDYATAFDRTSNVFRIPVGEEMKLFPTRGYGILIFGKRGVWALDPSAVPDPTTDKPVLIDPTYGCIAGNTVRQVGDNFYYLASDGVRVLVRNSDYDVFQIGTSIPLNFALKDQWSTINWSYISKASAEFFDNKYFLSVPKSGNVYNNEVWVFYPSSQSWMVITGWNVGVFATYKINNEERLYFTDATDQGKVYRGWTGYADDTSAIDLLLETAQEDLGEPLKYKVNGEIEIKAQSAGDYDLSIYASFDDEAYQLLGLVNLGGGAPQLPQNLPFYLSFNEISKEKFHLDHYGRWRNIRIKIEHNATNGSDDIIFLELTITGFIEEYENEIHD